MNFHELFRIRWSSFDFNIHIKSKVEIHSHTKQIHFSGFSIESAFALLGVHSLLSAVNWKLPNAFDHRNEPKSCSPSCPRSGSSGHIEACLPVLTETNPQGEAKQCLDRRQEGILPWPGWHLVTLRTVLAQWGHLKKKAMLAKHRGFWRLTFFTLHVSDSLPKPINNAQPPHSAEKGYVFPSLFYFCWNFPFISTHSGIGFEHFPL